MKISDEMIGKKVKLMIRSRRAIYCKIDKILDNRVWIVTNDGKYLIITSGIIEGIEVVE